MNKFKEARAKFDLIAVVSKFVKLRPSGRDFTGLCPFHKEDTPSFRVYSAGTFFCFGCHAWGDVTDFLTRIGRSDLLQSVARTSNPIAELTKKLNRTKTVSFSLTPGGVLKFMDKALTETGYLMLDFSDRYKRLTLNEDLKFLLNLHHRYKNIDSFFERLSDNFITFFRLKPVLPFLWDERDNLSRDFHFISFQISHQVNLDGKLLPQKYDTAVERYQDFLKLFYNFYPYLLKSRQTESTIIS